jgi:hypothetical protein
LENQFSIFSILLNDKPVVVDIVTGFGLVIPIAALGIRAARGFLNRALSDILLSFARHDMPLIVRLAVLYPRCLLDSRFADGIDHDISPLSLESP